MYKKYICFYVHIYVCIDPNMSDSHKRRHLEVEENIFEKIPSI